MEVSWAIFENLKLCCSIQLIIEKIRKKKIMKRSIS